MDRVRTEYSAMQKLLEESLTKVEFEIEKAFSDNFKRNSINMVGLKAFHTRLNFLMSMTPAKDTDIFRII